MSLNACTTNQNYRTKTETVIQIRHSFALIHVVRNKAFLKITLITLLLLLLFSYLKYKLWSNLCSFTETGQTRHFSFCVQVAKKFGDKQQIATGLFNSFSLEKKQQQSKSAPRVPFGRGEETQAREQIQ